MTTNAANRSKSGAATVDLNEYNLESARMLISILDEIHPVVRTHSMRVANNCANFCAKYKLFKNAKIERVYMAALVHDIGLIGTGSDLLTKLSAAEREAIPELRRHPVIGERILSNLSAFDEMLPIVRHHHERYDGEGYPDGKKADDIPLEARVMALFDHVDALLHPISSDKPATIEDALNDVTVKSGQNFDPELMDRFVEFIKELGAESADFMLQKEMSTLRKLFTEILQKFSAGKITPPVVPKVVHDIQKEIKQKSSDAKKLGAVIERDPVISLRLISIANSPVYRGMQDITNIRNALPRLGVKETLNIVFGIANKNLYTSDRAQFKILMDKLWVHSLSVAYTSKLLAKKIGLEDPDSLFLMGLIHDIGKTVLLKAFSEELAAKSYNLDAIVANINEAHHSVGAMLIKRWGFPQLVINTVSHHEGGDYSEDTAKEILIVNLANLIARTLGYSLYAENDIDFAELPAVKILKIDPTIIPEIGDEVKQIISEVAHLF